MAGGGPGVARLPASASCSLLPCGLRSALRGRRITRGPSRYGWAAQRARRGALRGLRKQCNAPGQRRIARSSAARLRLRPARCRAGSTLRYAEGESLCARSSSQCPSRSCSSAALCDRRPACTDGESYSDRPAPATATRAVHSALPAADRAQLSCAPSCARSIKHRSLNERYRRFYAKVGQKH